jgi:hypothetical protein
MSSYLVPESKTVIFQNNQRLATSGQFSNTRRRSSSRSLFVGKAPRTVTMMHFVNLHWMSRFADFASPARICWSCRCVFRSVAWSLISKPRSLFTYEGKAIAKIAANATVTTMAVERMDRCRCPVTSRQSKNRTAAARSPKTMPMPHPRRQYPRKTAPKKRQMNTTIENKDVHFPFCLASTVFTMPNILSLPSRGRRSQFDS